ncbi:protein broad-minded-like isoform X2 [Haliotis rufescens]|uniref:protein broad-minded-like isoform X2 n=1 Tax=Haliotis rufescens TaxID=6454 RepID=UPI001EAFBF77|nr:protein broad-minded-like isoform X2 [Haliotis rufescens]
MALSGGLEGQDLIRNLRQLIYSFEPYIREAVSTDQIEENLIHLEESEENFHKYEIIKLLKRKIDELLGPLIDDEIERFSTVGHIGANGQETVVSRITDRILQSQQYHDFNKKLKRNMTGAIDQLQQNFEQEFSGGRHGDAGFQTRRDNVVTDDEEGSVMMFDHDYMKHVADSLGKSKPTQTRRDALQKLNQIMSADSVNSDHWLQLKRNLQQVMSDPDEQLSALSVKFIAKAFTSTTHQTREIYILLTEYLLEQFQSPSSSIPHVKAGLDSVRPEISKLLKALRLMNEFQQEAPNYWIRYPDRYVEEIVESTLNLISVPQSGPTQRLAPLHFIALIDPKAQWFIKWMHGNYSRKVLLQTLEKYRPVVENTVKHCLEFSAARKFPQDMMSEMSDSVSKLSLNISSSDQRMFYTGPELDYAYFIHCVCILGKLLCFQNGRKFFPLKLKDESVTINRLLKALVLLIVDPGSSSSNKSPSNQYEPATFVTMVMKDLCKSEQVCQICLCNDDITDSLLSPVFKFLDNNLGNHPPSEGTLLHVADILSILASNSRGRCHLMYGEGRDLQNRSKSSAAHVIAEFTKKALMSSLPCGAGSQPSSTVVGAYLYICRQLYNTCQGLLVLQQYDLHNTVATAWREASQASDRAATPTPSDSSTDINKSHKEVSVLFWEDTLRDNLLNFASTAKGILLLQLTGAINECVSYMYTRYEKKLQVSKCEKFGYGVMVTQMAATAPGIVALQNTGYIKALMTELWSSLECGPSDEPVFTPKSWPVDAIDRLSHKHLSRLLNILSGFPAVYEVLAEKPLPVRDSYSFRTMPDTVDALMDRLVMIDSPAKIHSLFNYEQSHSFGLRVLCVMTSCLDTYLLLQSQYKFQEVLLQAQADNVTEGSDQTIVDVLSVERNFLLVKTHLIGGPTERMIPPRSLEQTRDGVYPYPLFSAYPLPREYCPNLAGRSAMKQDNELSKFLTGKGDRKMAWVEKGRNIFVKLLTNKPEQAKGSLMQQLLEQLVSTLSNIPEEAIFPLLDFSPDDSGMKKFTLSPLQLLGIKTVVRYGMHLKAINTSAAATDGLTQLLKQTGYFLKQQQKVFRSSLRYLHGGYPGFDWFAATVFLIFHGNMDRAWKFLYKFSSLGVSGYLWMPRLHASVHLPPPLMMSGIHPVFSSTAHNIEFILQTELPLVASAFKMSGYTPAQICVHWLKQCFWNFLDWGDICHYVCTCIVLGADYQVYTCVAILRHLQRDILQHMQTQELIFFLKEEPITGFRMAENIRYMQELEKRFRKIVQPDMMNITKP